MAYSSKKPKKTKTAAVDDEFRIDHAQLIRWVNDSEDLTLQARATAEKCRDYYDSKQWTPEEAAELTKRGQAATVINRIKPKVDGLLGMEKTQRTTAKAFARTPKHAAGADAATEAVRFVLQDNFYNQIRSNALENLCIEGSGGCEVVVKPEGDDWRIMIYPVYWDRMIYDPHSRRKDFSDARYLGQVVWMDFDEAVATYPEGRDVLSDMIDTNSNTYEDKPRWMDSARERAKIVELYYREGGEMKYCCFTRGGYLKAPMVSPYKNEEGETEWSYEFASAFVDRDNNRYGSVLQLLDVQDEINKRRSKALHLMSVRQIRLERGAVEDVNQVRRELAKPDGVVETTPGMEFEVLKTGDMAAAQANLLTDAKMEIDSVGFNAAVSGKDQRAQSGIALQARTQAGQTELAPLFDVLRHLDIRVYRKVWNRIKQYWKAEKWIRVTDDEANLQWVGLNKPVTRGEQMLQMAQQQKVPPEQLAMLEQRIAADPMMSEVVGTENEIAELDVDIVMADAPDVASMEVEQFQALAEVMKSGAPPMLMDALIESSQIPHKERVLKRLRGEVDIPPQVQQQMEQMQEQLQAAGQELEKTKQENIGLKQDQSVDVAKAQADAKLKKEELDFKVALQTQELQLERAKIEAQIELERAKAAAQIEIENIKMGAQNEQAKAKLEFDRKCKMMENPEFADLQVMPQMTEAMDKLAQSFQNIDAILQNQLALQQRTLDAQLATIEAISRPRNVSLSNVQRDEAGHVTGATVRPVLQ